MVGKTWIATPPWFCWVFTVRRCHQPPSCGGETKHTLTTLTTTSTGSLAFGTWFGLVNPPPMCRSVSVSQVERKQPYCSNPSCQWRVFFFLGWGGVHLNIDAAAIPSCHLGKGGQILWLHSRLLNTTCTLNMRPSQSLWLSWGTTCQLRRPIFWVWLKDIHGDMPLHVIMYYSPKTQVKINIKLSDEPTAASHL